MIESVWSKTAGEFVVGKFHVLFRDFGIVNQISEISKNNCFFFRVVFDEKVIDIFDAVLVIRNNT